MLCFFCGKWFFKFLKDISSDSVKPLFDFGFIGWFVPPLIHNNFVIKLFVKNDLIFKLLLGSGSCEVHR